jgi:hypothetical protein
MTLDELGARLKELEGVRKLAQAELEKVLTCKERVDELEWDRDALLESYAGMVPKALDSLSGEERNRLYGILRLQVSPARDGFEVAGTFCTSERSSIPT